MANTPPPSSPARTQNTDREIERAGILRGLEIAAFRRRVRVVALPVGLAALTTVIALIGGLPSLTAFILAALASLMGVAGGLSLGLGSPSSEEQILQNLVDEDPALAAKRGRVAMMLRDRSQRSLLGDGNNER